MKSIKIHGNSVHILLKKKKSPFYFQRVVQKVTSNVFGDNKVFDPFRVHYCVECKKEGTENKHPVV